MNILKRGISMKKVSLTGLKPTGSLTLGNYIGSISQMVKMQDEYDNYLFVATRPKQSLVM